MPLDEVPLHPKTSEPIYQSDNGLIGYRKSVQFAYNPNNELKQTITIIDTGLQVQRTTTSYFYDAFGRRIAKSSQVERLNKLNQKGELVRYPTALMHLRKTDKTTYQSTLMLWEGNRQIQEYTDDFVFTTVYDQDSFEAVARVVQSRQAQDKTQGNTQGNDNDKVELFKIYHYHNNHLGTPQELTNEQGEVVWLGYDYAWGGRYQSYYKEQSLNNIAIDKDHLQPLRFQGQFFDQETELHYNRFRYYDTDVGMFISRDPIGLLGGVNVFAYAPNPIHWIDPLGLDVYELTARSDGWFPVYEKGKAEPIAYQFLKQGETYKFGESKNSNNRYTKTQLDEGRIHQPSKTNGQKFTSFGVDVNGKALFSIDTNGNIISTQPAGLDMTLLSVGGTKTQDRIQETNLINNYRNTHGQLPAGNKTCH